MLMKFKTSFYEHGILMKNHRKIMDFYLRGDFLLDFLSLLSLLINVFICYQSPLKWLMVFFFSKTKSIKNIFRNLENIIDFGEGFELFFVMFKVLCVAHIYACFWHYISFLEIQNHNTDTWLVVKGLENAFWMEKYLYSIYWALTTMVTVGYGDIVPQNRVEVGFCSFTILSGSMVFGYCLNRIGTLLTGIDERDKELK